MEHLVHILPFILIGLLILRPKPAVLLLIIFLSVHLFPSTVLMHHQVTQPDHAFHYCCMPESTALPLVSYLPPTPTILNFKQILAPQDFPELIWNLSNKSPPSIS